jgi:hypothetical protein
MFRYTKREDSRNSFSHPREQKGFPAQVRMVRRLGPHWVVVGRRPRTIPVFIVRTTVLLGGVVS